jgi:hypothetical protein
MRILSKKYLATWSTELLKSQLKSIDLQIKNFSNPYNDESDKYDTRFLQLHRISIDIKKELQTR